MYSFIITTHYNNYDKIYKCLYNLSKVLDIIDIDYMVLVYINETTCTKVKNLPNEFYNYNFTYIDDQISNFGLTGTWNMGIIQSIKENCDVVTILGHDTYVNNSIIYTLAAAKFANDNDIFEYFSVLYNSHGGKDELWQDSKVYYKYNIKYLIGFFLCIPIKTLQLSKISNHEFFSKNFPFGANYMEFYDRIIKLNGKGTIIYNTIIDHIYARSWVEIDKKIRETKTNKLPLESKQFNKLPLESKQLNKEFNWISYLKKNPDLKFSNELEAKKHYYSIGIQQKRIF